MGKGAAGGKKETEEAIGHLEAAATLSPDDAFVHYQLQGAYRRAGSTEDANRELQRYKDIKASKREGAWRSIRDVKRRRPDGLSDFLLEVHLKSHAPGEFFH